VTGLARVRLGQQIIGGFRARDHASMTLRAGKLELQVELMRERPSSKGRSPEKQNRYFL